MARKTKAQLMAEQAAYQAELLAAEEAQYPTLLMNMLERATKLGYELTVANSKFVVRDLHAHDQWSMTPGYTQDGQDGLDELVWAVDEEELRRIAVKARADAKAAALSKLTKEEKELLGL